MEFRKLSDVAELTVGYVGTMGREYSEQGVLFLRSLNIKSFGFDLSDVKYIPEEFHKKLSKSALQTNDVVIVRTGLPGTCAVIPSELNGCNCADLVIVRPNLKLIDPFYLCAFINSWGKSQVSNAKVGAVQKHFNVTSAEEMLIPMIDLETQKLVSGVLCNINNKIDNNNAICSDLEAMAKLLYDYWFVQFDFPDENGKPYKSSGGKMVWNEDLKREIPEGWEVKHLIDCVSKEKNAIVDGPFGTQMKISEYVADGIPVYEMEQLNGAFIVDKAKHYLTEKKYEEVKRSTVRNGDIIISKTGTLGLLGIVNSQYDKGIIVSRLAKITPDDSVIGKYALLIHLKELADIGYWLNVCGGSTMPILNNGTIGNVQLTIPNNDLYQRFEAIVAPMFDVVFKSQVENNQLLSLRDFLLPMLMNGQVKVSAAE